MTATGSWCRNCVKVEVLQATTLILGLGNDILTDDGVGLAVVRRLAPRLSGAAHVVLRETMEMGLALLDFLVGFQQVVVVDAIQTGRNPPGTVYEVDIDRWRRLSGSTPHFLGLGETLSLGRQLGLPMPRMVTVVAIEVEDPYTFGTRLTPAASAGVLEAVDRVEQLVQGTARTSDLPAALG